MIVNLLGQSRLRPAQELAGTHVGELPGLYQEHRATAILDRDTIGDVPSRPGIQIEDVSMKRIALDLDDLRQRYEQGHSVLKMARDLNVSRPVIQRRLASLGLPIRNASEANRLRMANLTVQERRKLTSAANAARRTRIKFEGKARRPDRAQATVNSARSRTRLIGKGEPELVDLLIARGLPVECQVPVYGYNLDIAVWPVAVEVWWGEGYPLRHGRQARRMMDIADLGWS